MVAYRRRLAAVNVFTRWYRVDAPELGLAISRFGAADSRHLHDYHQPSDYVRAIRTSAQSRKRFVCGPIRRFEATILATLCPRADESLDQGMPEYFWQSSVLLFTRANPHRSAQRRLASTGGIGISRGSLAASKSKHPQRSASDRATRPPTAGWLI